MKRQHWFHGLVGFILCLGLLGNPSGGQAGAGRVTPGGRLQSEAGLAGHSRIDRQPASPVQSRLLSSPAETASGFMPLVVEASRYDRSPALSRLAEQVAPSQPEGPSGAQQMVNFGALPLPKAQAAPAQPGGELAQGLPQMAAPSAAMPAPLQSFDGVNNQFGGWPPDTQGDIGAQHYVQWINLHFSIWKIDRVNNTASKVLGPLPGNTLFKGFGGPCEATNHGDPITLYDALAGRWLMSQFALPSYPNGPFYQCLAVSLTADPTGSWYRYQFQMPVNNMNDYPKFGVWPDAYYWTINMFASGTGSWAGAGVGAFERSAMLSGGPARLVFFNLYSVNSSFGGILPADLDGATPPPAGAPGLFAEWDDSTWIAPSDAMRLWEFHVDWTNPASSSFGLSGQPNQVLPTDNVDPNLCGYARACLPQPGTTNRLDAISDRLMYRLQYRNYGAYQTLVTNHTVDANSQDLAGIHWMELHLQNGTSDWSLFQQGLYSPDNSSRWMGSAALDRAGNLAVGYSVTSASVYPSVRYAGRLASDPLGVLLQGENSLVAGSGVQTLSNRWGDYSMLSVDPLDDCTFWYTQEYIATTGSNTWTTRIGAFRFANCAYDRQGRLDGRVTDATTSQPLDGVQISATQGLTFSLQTLSAADGGYSLALPEGAFQVSAATFGYQTQVDPSVGVISGSVTLHDFAMQPLARVVISGTVRDAQTGWPLYARLALPGTPLAQTWSDPLSGHYSLTVPIGAAYTLTAAALAPGYLPASLSVPPPGADVSLDIGLQADPQNCTAPGYQLVVTPTLQTDFEASNGGLAAGGAGSWVWGIPTSGPGAAHSGLRAWATNLSGNYSNSENGWASVPPQDLSAYAGTRPVVRWYQWLQTEPGYDFARLEASVDNGATWTAVYGPASGAVDLAWTERQVLLDPAYAVANLRLRFRLQTDNSVTYPGWYLDDLLVGAGQCLPQPGGLVVGSTFDLNTGAALPLAEVTNDSGYTATSQAATGGLPSIYILFSPPGSHVITATHSGGYVPVVQGVTVSPGGTMQQDLSLAAGRLEIGAATPDVSLQLGQSLTVTGWVSNTGSAPASFDLVKLPRQTLPLGPFQQPNFGVKTFRENFPSTEGISLPPLPDAPLVITAGQRLRTWNPAGVVGPWGVAYNDLRDSLWVSSPAESWGGVDRLYEFEPDGTPTSVSYPITPPHSSGPADLAYNWDTGMLWSMNINTGVANCIYEIDPSSGYTGNKICPGGSTGFSLSQRGLAYDPASGSWFAGGWNDQMLYRFDSQGNILSQASVGIPVSGLAYNPDTQHLFALVNASETRIYVLSSELQLLGYFKPSSGFTANSAGGLEMDCDGNLWAVDQTADEVVQMSSGETSTVCLRQVPWLNVTPQGGNPSAGQAQPLEIGFQTSVLDQPGIYRSWLNVRERTPYDTPALPLTLTVTAPPDWGKLNGVVDTPGYCDANPAPLQGAALTIESRGGLTWTLSTDANGYFQRWFDQALSPFTITVKASGYASGLAGGIQVSGGLTTTQDFTLDWLMPCIQVDPLVITATLKTGYKALLPVTLRNLGHAASSYAWYESYAPVTPIAEVPWLAIQPLTGTISALTQALPFTLTLDATGLDPGVSGTDYLAYLNLSTLDSFQPVITVPVTLTVMPLQHGVALSPPQAGQGVRGQAVRYTITLTNTGDLEDAYALSLGAHAWNASLAPAQVGPLLPGQTAQVTATMNIPAEASSGAQEVVDIYAAWIGSPAPASPPATQLTTTVIPAVADLRLAAGYPAVTAVSRPMTYTLTITNSGPTAAPRAVLVLVLPQQVASISLTTGCLRSGQVVNCELGLLAAGQSRQVTVVGRPIATGLLIGQAMVSSEASDMQPADNWATLLTQVLGYLLRLAVVRR